MAFVDASNIQSDKNILLEDYAQYGNPMVKPGVREPSSRSDITVIGEFQNIIDSLATAPAYELEDLGAFAALDDGDEEYPEGEGAQKPTKGKKKAASKKFRMN